MAVVWWPNVVYLPGALLILLGGIGSLATLWTYWRRAGLAEALRIANETRAQLQALVDAQHETNVDIDRRLREITADKAALARHVADQDAQLARQAAEIDNLKQGRVLQDHRLTRIEAERDRLAARLNRILKWLADAGIALPDDLREETP